MLCEGRLETLEDKGCVLGCDGREEVGRVLMSGAMAWWKVKQDLCSSNDLGE